MPGVTDVELFDWFAGQALMGAFSGRSQWPTSEDTWDAFAWSCYGIADSMLKERKKHAHHPVKPLHHPKQHAHTS